MPTGTEIKNIILNVNGEDAKKKIEDYREAIDIRTGILVGENWSPPP